MAFQYSFNISFLRYAVVLVTDYLHVEDPMSLPRLDMGNVFDSSLLKMLGC
jgi:hypothetical protein